jgi:tripartite-type tricarboxylate transporter receptor subunit TctC
MAPKGLSPNVQSRLTTELAKVLKDPDLLKRFVEQGVTPGNMKSTQLGEFIKVETNKWAKVVKESGAVVD